MGKLKKGDSTKDTIKNVSRKFFYEHGYSNTKIQMITKDTGISRTLINYHFSSKEDILVSVMKDFLDEVYQFVDRKIPDDPLMKYFVFFDLYYKKWTSDRNMSAFLLEVLNRDNRVLQTYMNFDVIYRGLVKQFKLRIDDRQLLLKEIAIFGANKEFLSNYLRGVMTVDYDILLENLISNGCKILGIPNIVINDYIQRYSAICDDLNHEHLHFYKGNGNGK